MIDNEAVQIEKHYNKTISGKWQAQLGDKIVQNGKRGSLWVVKYHYIPIFVCETV